MNEQVGDVYDFQAIQDRWLPVWDDLKPFDVSNDLSSEKPKKYVL